MTILALPSAEAIYSSSGRQCATVLFFGGASMAKKSKKASQTGSREPNLVTIAYAARLERQVNR
jgi:hypothetical protein